MQTLKRIFSKSIFKRDFYLAIIAGVIFSMLFALAGFDAKCDDLRTNVLRLHVIANSDSAEDQAIKLKIRDELLKTSDGLFNKASNKQDTIKIAKENLLLFENAAKKVLLEEGKNQNVNISIGKAYFNTREYEDFTLPAGEYDAVKVLIGKAEGKNWWCVMFPSMCIPAAKKKHELTEAVDESSAKIAEEAPKYEVRFKVVEWYESIRQGIKNLFY